MRLLVPVPDKPAWAQLAEILRATRVAAGLTHRDVAERVGVPTERVRAWETFEVDRRANLGRIVVPQGRTWARLKGSFRSLHSAMLVWQAALREAGAGDEDVRAETAEASDIIEMAKGLPIEEPVREEGQLPPPLPEVSQQATFGAALRTARINNGLTQEEVAEMLQVSNSTISTWERDDNAPVQDNWRRLRDLMPEMRDAPPPGSRNIPKPQGNPVGVTGPRLVPSPPRSKEVPTTDAPSFSGTLVGVTTPTPARPDDAADVAFLGAKYGKALVVATEAKRRLAVMEAEVLKAREAAVEAELQEQLAHEALLEEVRKQCTRS